jgi:4-amino-4-deoxy-L-arabinose transferase-like glycosyltransferase
MQSAIEQFLPKRSAERRAAVLILVFLALRLALSSIFPLIADEAYAVVVSRYPTLSYFDHPPLGFDFARAAAWLFGSEAAFVVRLPHVLLGSASAWLIFLVTRRAFGAEAAFWAVAWYSVAPFFFISSGHFVVPDGPLNFFLLMTLWLVLPDLLEDRKPDTRRWLLAGLTLGAALLSKYTAVLFGVAAFILLLWLPRGRRVLASPGPWIALVIAALCLTPVLIWNIQNGWASFGFQSDRAFGGVLNPANFLAVQLGQAGYLLPWTWAVALFMVARGIIRPRMPAEHIFAVLAALPIALFDVVSILGSEILPHWAMPGFLFAFPLVGLWCSTMRHVLPAAIRRLFAGSAIAVPVLAVLVVLQTNQALLTRALGLPSVGFDWTILRWDALADDFAQRGILADEQAYLVPASWLVGGKAGYDLGPSLPVASPVTDPRHFAFVDDPRLPGRTKGYAIIAVWPGGSEAGLSDLDKVLAGRYRRNGAPWTVRQNVGGASAFEIVVLPVERF